MSFFNKSQPNKALQQAKMQHQLSDQVADAVQDIHSLKQELSDVRQSCDQIRQQMRKLRGLEENDWQQQVLDEPVLEAEYSRCNEDGAVLDLPLKRP